MRTLTITGVKTLIRSPEGHEVTLHFSTKYVGDLALTMPADCVGALISTLSGVEPEPGADVPVVPAPSAAPSVSPAPAAPMLPDAAAAPTPPVAAPAPPVAAPTPPVAAPPAAAPPAAASTEPAELAQPATVRDAKGTKGLKVTVPKTWVVTADLQVHGVVIVVFDHKTEARIGYALGADTAKQMAVGLTKNADAVLNSKTAKQPPPPGSSSEFVF